MTTLLVVQLEPGLGRSRTVGLIHLIAHTPGVKGVADITMLSQESLDRMLLKPEQQPATKRKRRSSAAA